MTIEEAYKVLGLDFGASEELIDKKFRELVKVHHPDKGGDNAKMTELNTAKDLTLSFIKNKDIYALAIRQVRDLISVERQLQTQKEEYKSEAQTLFKKLDQTRGTYKSIKDISVFVGIIAGIFVLLGSNILPVYQQEVGQDASKDITKYVLIYGAAFGIVYLFLSNLEAKVKERIEAFKDNLDNKKIVAKLLFEILFLQHEREEEFERRPKTELKEFSESSFEKSVNEWMGGSRVRTPVTMIAEILLASSERDSIRKTARQMGREDFTQLVLLKSQEKELIEELEIDIHNDDVKYGITQELEKLRLKYKKNRLDRKNRHE